MRGVQLQGRQGDGSGVRWDTECLDRAVAALFICKDLDLVACHRLRVEITRRGLPRHAGCAVRVFLLRDFAHSRGSDTAAGGVVVAHRPSLPVQHVAGKYRMDPRGLASLIGEATNQSRNVGVSGKRADCEGRNVGQSQPDAPEGPVFLRCRYSGRAARHTIVVEDIVAFDGPQPP